MVEAFNLATGEKQDQIITETDKIQSVKDDTDYIRGQFPISGGTDFSKVSTKKVITNILKGETGFKQALHVTGKGSITYLNLDNRLVDGIIHLDGESIVVPNDLGGSSANNYAVNLRFKTSVEVKFRCTDNTTVSNPAVLYELY